MYNKRQGTDYKTLQEFSLVADGKRLLEGIRESVITGKPIKYKSKKVAPKVTKETQIDLFDVENTPNVLSVNRSVLESLNDELDNFKNIDEEKSKEISKFVKEDTITDASVIDQIKDALSCFK
jgi:molecular chaperone GrpE (heat shock protein)